MPFSAVTLKPGVDTQKTPSMNEAGVIQSQLIRYKDGMIQSYGGWQAVSGMTSPSTVRDVHAWQDSAGNKLVGIGATANLLVYSASLAAITDITPQKTTTNPSPQFSTTIGSATVQVNDVNSGASVYNTLFINTPISVGGVFLSGAYAITNVLSTGSFQISASAVATATSTVSTLPVFTFTNGSALVSVLSANSYYIAQTGLYYPFRATTTIASTNITAPTIVGNYQVQKITSTAGSSYTYQIGTTFTASAAFSVTMNASLAQLVYHITGAPSPVGGGFGTGTFGSGSWGTGATAGAVTGTPITATDWSLDNWGDLLIGCPKDGPIYIWSVSLGFNTAQAVTEAPFFNGGLFVAHPQQILVVWKSVQSTTAQDPLVVRWCNQLDYRNWAVTNQTTAGSFHLPSGSYIVGGIQGPTYALISTDLDVWVMQYVGGDVVFNFTQIGTACGWIGSHAAGILNNNIYWMGLNNFFMVGPAGAQALPCSVWDIVFQNISSTYMSKAKCAVNSSFNEIMWLYPSAASTGENDSYVKATFEHGTIEWDYGAISRTGWIDVSVMGQPIGCDAAGSFYQHEVGVAHPGTSSPVFQTGWWAIAEGNDFGFIDFIIPDFVWELRSGTVNTAVIELTFMAVDYPNDTPRIYGPYTCNDATTFINTRIRGRLLAVSCISSNDAFFRLGKIRFRVATSGRR